MITITDRTKCCGCAACYSVCKKKSILMVEDNEGFLYPVVNKDSCVNCGMCEKVCPILNQKECGTNVNQKAVLVQHKDEEKLKQSTAGGAFTAIAEYVIDKGGIVFGVEMDENYFVHHTSVENKTDLFKYRNSKYVQSYVGDTYKRVREELHNSRLVCFSGTPCQIEGLRHYLQREYDNLLLVDVVCRAVPSPGVWKKYIEMETRKCGKITSIRFRDKSLGYQYSTMELKSVDGKVYRGGIESQPWLRMFFSGMIIRPSCTECMFRSRYRNSDFTIWDCFNSFHLSRKFDERRGTTRVLIHSKKGLEIFDKIKCNFEYVFLPADDVVLGVNEMKQSPNYNIHRGEFYRDLESNSIQMAINKYYPTTLKLVVKEKIRVIFNHLGLDVFLKRIIKK